MSSQPSYSSIVGAAPDADSSMPDADSSVPHLLSYMIDHAIRYSDTVSKLFDIANRLTSSSPDYDEGFMSGESTGHPDMDRKLQDLDLRLKVLQRSIEEFQGINYYGIQSISNEFGCRAASALVQAVKEIGQIGTELEALFCKDRNDLYYDFDHAINEALITTEVERDDICKQLMDVADGLPANPRPAHTRLRLCPLAKRLVDGFDDGHINYIDTKNLNSTEKATLAKSGGSFQFWKCEECKHEIRYYVRQSRCSTLLTTTESQKHACLTYRKALLAKSHLEQGRRSMQQYRYACLLCMAGGKDLRRDHTAFKNTKGLLDHLEEHHNERSLPEFFMRQLHFIEPAEQDIAGPCDLKFG